MKAVKKLASVLKGFFIIINVWLKVESMISILKLWKKHIQIKSQEAR